MDMASVSGWLKQWAKEKRIEERSVQTFWQFVRCYESEHPEQCRKHFGDLDDRLFTVAVTDISVTLAEWPECSRGYITAYIPIVYKGEDIGTYRAIFTLAGEDEDDYFSLDSYRSEKA